jgi:glyoxylase-like metal-dependent hydrolase (beta-lactamase superfamily II)
MTIARMTITRHAAIPTLLLAAAAAAAQAPPSRGSPPQGPARPPASTIEAPRTLTPARTTAWDLELVPLRDGLYLLRRPDVLRQPVEPNVLVIVNEADVVVVDAGGTPLAAENAIRLVRSITSKPVSVLVNTHWHGDHTFGNATWRAAFPGLVVVGHPNTRRDVLGAQARYLASMPAQLEPMLQALRERVAKGEASERQRALLADGEQALVEARRTVASPPDQLVEGTLVLRRGAREIQVRHLGRGNTEGDLVVWLPRERVVASGDLVVTPIPYGFGSFPKDWIAALDQLAALDFELLVPGHGEVQRDAGALRTLQALLREVRAQVAASVARGLDLDATRKALDLAPFQRQLAGDDPYRVHLFEAWWTSPIARSAWLEAKGLPIQQGASDETG